MNQKTAFQAFTGIITPSIKSNPVVNHLLKASGALSRLLDRKGIIYDDTDSIVRNVLSQLDVEATPKEIATYQEECKNLFAPSLRLQYGCRELLLYPLIRILKPKVIVETGCAWGGSASFLLAALHKNGLGELFSIDLPASGVSQAKFMGVKKEQIGALVPQELKKRWNLIVGDARVELPKLLAAVDADIFIHDSLHTTSHQAFEYITARSLMREGTIIASDDIRWNDAFRAFVTLHHLSGYVHLADKNFGLTLNRFDAYEKENSLYR